MPWTTLRLRVETPLFCGDGDPTSAQVRVSSIRGGMHFWLRAMAGVLAGKDLDALRRIENRVLGSTEAVSPIRLRIPAQPRFSTEPFPDFLPRAQSPNNKWISYLLGPGLTAWEPRDQRKGLPGATKITRAFTPPGEEFDLRIKLVGEDRDAHTVALGALWMSLVFGGIGARTRRGFGGIRITGVEGGSLLDWPENALLSPGLDFYENTKSLWPSGTASRAMPALMAIAEKAGLPKRVHDWSAPPTYPVLSKTRTVAGVSGGGTFPDWVNVLIQAGEELRHFRASEFTPQVMYSPKVKTREWLEVVHDEDRDDFALGGLGLPIVFKKDTEVHADRGEGQEAETLRRASPLWLRPVGEGDEWRLFSFAFLTEFLPEEEVGVHLWRGQGGGKRQSRELTVTTEDSHALVREWIEGITEAEGTAFVP
ncbi:type III-B CRISPR module RAMP protein Cmr1 [Nocardiopsis sp. LOL_012]|uniref:type III-B CRISPR module RAMP protein Cmr1 n=1 Tax=Nocardiopsis sp. LOL_012 TaxID=3345409 RepID=UPI003A8410DE